jgi:hypothetical protein
MVQSNCHILTSAAWNSESIVQTPLGGPHLSKVVTLHAIKSRLRGRVLEVAVKKELVIVVMR